jgi:hypothetical protein
MAQAVRRSGVRRVPLSDNRDRSLPVSARGRRRGDRIARDGKPAGVLIGFESEHDWLDYRLEKDPRFLRRVEQARKSLRERHGIRIDEVE